METNNTTNHPLSPHHLQRPPQVEAETNPAHPAEYPYRMAKLYYDKADLPNAEKNFLLALGHCQETDDLFFGFKILGFLIRIASENLDQVRANDYIEQSEAFLEKVKDDAPHLAKQAEFLYNQGVIYTYRGDFTKGKNAFLKALEQSSKENGPEILAKCLFSLATHFYQKNEWKVAKRYLHQLEELSKILEKKYLLGATYHLLGKVATGEGELGPALSYFSKANLAFKGKCSWNLYGHNLLGQGIVYKKYGEFQKALLYFDLALQAICQDNFCRLTKLIEREIDDVNDSNVDLYLDRHQRMAYEKRLGAIDFKHRFILLEILFLLAENPGVYYDKEELVKKIWKDEYNPLIHDKLIYTSVSRLRKLIEPKGNKRKYIIRDKEGYTFNQKVKARFKKTGQIEKDFQMAHIEFSSPV